LANCGSGCWDDGWRVSAFEGNEIAAVTKGGLTLQVEFNCMRPKPQQIGQALSVRFPNEELAMSPGYYIATGIRALPEEGRELFRLYWNIEARDAVWLMGRLTAALQDESVAFRFKTLKDPGAYRRTDAAVLYFSRRDAEVIRRVVGDVYAKLPTGPKTQVPALTFPLGPGLGFAEDPGGAQSFGLHRCRLVAEALVSAYHRGAQSIRERMEIVENRFLQEGILLDQPYLHRQSTDPVSALVIAGTQGHRRSARVQRIGRDKCIADATEIGIRLCRDAFWHRDACTWVGDVPDPNADTDMLTATDCRTLGPDLYAGTSGIGLFLAQLHAIAPYKEVRRTALGAMRHALSRVNPAEPYLRFGLYTGSCGIVLAGLRVAQLLKDEETQHCSRKMAGRVLARLARPRYLESDLLSGKAGIIVTLLLLAKEFDWDEALSTAVRMGDQLLRNAHKNKAGISWPSARIRRRRNLTGFSHGAAGIALALLELSAVVHEERFAIAAQRAFQYEEQHFDPDTRNWRDFRQPDSFMRRVFAWAWCNGAPGIALSRMRAWKLSSCPFRRDEAERALLTTRKWLANALNTRESASCLCHGLIGNADILLVSEQMMGPLCPARNLIEQSAAFAHAPPSTPGLMLGQAGLGYFLLRVANPTIVPPVLLITPGWLKP
jgi:hypothetical protein